MASNPEAASKPRCEAGIGGAEAFVRGFVERVWGCYARIIIGSWIGDPETLLGDMSGVLGFGVSRAPRENMLFKNGHKA